MKSSITNLEFKKIISNRAVKVSLFLIFIYIIIALIGSVKVANYETLDTSSNVTKQLKGMNAIKQKKADVAKIKGDLDENYIRNVISNYNHLKDNKGNLNKKGELKEDVVYNYWLPYSDIESLLLESYIPINTIDDAILDKLKPDNAKDFYSNRIKKIKDSLSVDYKKVKFSESDITAITQKAEELKKPMHYDYADGWFKLMDNFPFLNFLIILIICFCVCRVFTEDIQNQMQLVVMPSMYGKTKLALSKINASIIFASITYLVMNLVFAVILLSIYGFSGWNCPIQINTKYWQSIYNVEIYEVYLQSIIIGLIACLFMVILTLLLANIFKKSVPAISAVSTFLLLPLLINIDKLPTALNRILGVFPTYIVDYMETIRKPYVYNIFGKEVLRGYITPIILIVIGIILIPFIIRTYNKQEA